jgi:hypothetical protein
VADVRDDDSGTIAAVREHAPADPTSVLFVVKPARDAKRGWVSRQREAISKMRVNKGNSLVAPTHLVSLSSIESC